MTAYRLHYFPESGNSYKLALMLTLCGQTFEPVWTDFGGGVTRTPEWRASVNPMGEIPVLEEDGVRLTQTAPILLQLAERYGRFGGETAQEKFEVLRWLFWDNHKLTGYVATYRFQPDILEVAQSAGAGFLPQAHRGFSRDFGTAHERPCLRRRRSADGGRFFTDGLSVLSERRNRI